MLSGAVIVVGAGVISSGCNSESDSEGKIMNENEGIGYRVLCLAVYGALLIALMGLIVTTGLVAVECWEVWGWAAH